MSLTQLEYIQKCKNKHGDKFVYDNITFTKLLETVIVTCVNHGKFEVIARNHISQLNGGCKLCNTTNDNLILRKIKDVSCKLIEFNSCRNIIIEDVNQLRYNASVKSLTKGFKPNIQNACDKTKYFIYIAIKTHGEIFNYSKSIYVNGKEPLIVTCKLHGDFIVNPINHMAGVKGCKDCLREFLLIHNKKMNKIANMNRHENVKLNFIEKCKIVHGDTYLYNKTIYTLTGDRVTITCRIHGDFIQLPHNHLSGAGCMNCKSIKSNIGVKKFIKNNIKKHASLYIIKCFNDNEYFYKIGITTKNLTRRFSGMLMPYDYEVIHLFNGDVKEMFILEQQLHKLYGKYRYTPDIYFPGITECFKMEEYDV